MAKQSLLIVDADERSLRVLEVSLRGAGYNVASCGNAGKALEVLHANQPDLILADTSLPDINGFELVERLRANPKWAAIPFMFLSSDSSVESKIRGLELGVGEYLTKPVYIREVISRVGIELAKHQRDGLAKRSSQHPNLRGSLEDMSVADLLQTIDDNQKSGVLYLLSWEDERGAIFFESGSVIHAHVGELRGEEAVFKLMLWSRGSFDFEFRRIRDGERTVHETTVALIMEGMRRIDERGRLGEQLPPADAVLELDEAALRDRLKDMPDSHNSMLRLIDGNRTLGEIVGLHGGDDLDALRKVVSLYFEGVVRQAGMPVNSVPIVEPETGESQRSGPDTLPGPGGGSVPVQYADVPKAPAPPASRLRHDTPLGFQSAPLADVARNIGGSAAPTDVVDPEASRPTSRPPAPESSEQSQDVTRGEKMGDTRIGGWRAKSDPPDAPNGGAVEQDVIDHDDRVTPLSDPAPHTSIGKLKRNTILGWAGGGSTQESVQMKPLTGEHQVPATALDKVKARLQEPDISDRTTRVSEEDWLKDQLDRETVVGDSWDNTLQELQADPEIDDAIAAIDSDSPPAAIVESKPPAAIVESKPPAATVESKPPAAREPDPGDSKNTAAHFRGSHDIDDALSRGVSSYDEEDLGAAPIEEISDIDPDDDDVEILVEYDPPPGLHMAPLTYDEIVEEEEYERRRREDPLKYAEPLGRPAPVIDEEASLRPSRRPMIWFATAMAVLAAGAGLYLMRDQTRSREVEIPDRVVRPELVQAPKTPAPKPPRATPAVAKAPKPSKPTTSKQSSVAKPAPTKVADAKPVPAKPTEAALPPPKPKKPSIAKPAKTTPPAVKPSEPAQPSDGSYADALAEAKRLRRGARAVAAYRRAIEINPQGAEAHIELAFLELNRGKYKEAMSLASRATKLDPSSSKAWVTLGAARQQLRDRAGAQDAYTQCVRQGKGKYVRECRAMLR